MDVEPAGSGEGVESLTSRFSGMELGLRQLTDVIEAYSLPDGFLESVLLAARMERMAELLAADGQEEASSSKKKSSRGLDVATVRKQVTTFAPLSYPYTPP